MKKITFFILTAFLFFSCNHSSINIEDKDIVNVAFVNKSSFEVNVYTYENPLNGKAADISIASGCEKIIKLKPSPSEMGDAFYFEYLVPVGNIYFPYFSYNNSKNYRIERGKQNKIIIDELISCPTNYSYIILENCTTSPIRLINGNNYEPICTCFSSTNQENKEFFINPQNEGVYLLGKNDDNIFYQAKNLAVEINGEKLKFPEIDYVLGNIYTFEVKNNTIELKSIVPFDVDTDRKIWTVTTSSLLCNSFVKPIIRKRKNIEEESIICGTVPNRNYSIGMQKINQYGQLSNIQTVTIKHNSSVNVDFSYVIDFLEEDDGSLILLLQNEFSENGKDETKQILCSYNFDLQKLNWSFVFEKEYVFNLNSRNIIIKLPDGRICLAGAIIENDVMGLWFGAYNPLDKSLKTVKSGYGSDINQNIETMFTSIYFDGTDFYVCGFENCDYKYAGKIHKGIIYKINYDLTSTSLIYEHDKVLFFSIDGEGKDYFACGEYADSGNILKSCFISSEMISNNQNLKIYTGKNAYSQFNQLFVNENKIYLMGCSSSDFAGEQSISPLLITVKRNGDEIFRNEDFGKYNKAVSIIPNNIGTYILELYSSDYQKIKYVSVDMLGKEK